MARVEEEKPPVHVKLTLSPNGRKEKKMEKEEEAPQGKSYNYFWNKVIACETDFIGVYHVQSHTLSFFYSMARGRG